MPDSIPMRQDMTMLRLREAHFRTARLTAVFAVPLREETAAEYAALPGLLTRTTRRYPTVAQMSRRLDNLYGAALEADTLRMGETQLLRFSVSHLEQRYVPDGTDLAADCCELLLDVLFDPALEDGAIRESELMQERRCLTERLQSEMNDKRRYARRRCEELLCPGEPYSVNPYGTEETVAALTPAAVTAAWRRLLTEARILWICQGGGDTDRLCRAIAERFDTLPARRAVPLPADPSFTFKQDEQTETMPLNQAKLVLGFRIAASEPDGPVAAARLMTALWGGSPASLLFRHVREEQSLCYYCMASYDRFQGVILVDSGIDAADAERVRDSVDAQLDTLRQGNFSDEELEAARRYLIQQLESFDASPAAREGWYAAQIVCSVYTTPEKAANAVRAVTREDVCRVARLAHRDTTYLLCPDEKEATV